MSKFANLCAAFAFTELAAACVSARSGPLPAPAMAQARAALPSSRPAAAVYAGPDLVDVETREGPPPATFA
jgi:hypothetical protein